MKRISAIRLSIIALVALCPFATSNGGASLDENAAGVIANVNGDIIYVAENAWDRGEALQEAVRAGVDLRNASLRGQSLRDIRLSGANLSGADFSGATLEDVDFSGANLSRAKFDGASFRHVSIKKANLQGAKLFI